jgi:hypothetical protein
VALPTFSAIAVRCVSVGLDGPLGDLLPHPESAVDNTAVATTHPLPLLIAAPCPLRGRFAASPSAVTIGAAPCRLNRQMRALAVFEGKWPLT